MKDLATTNNDIFLPQTLATPDLNVAAVSKVKKCLPAMTAQAKSFGSSNSQSMLTNMTLTMMNGHSPMRMLRQVLAETESRRKKLVSVQVSHAEAVEDVEKLSSIVNRSNLEEAKYRQAVIILEDMETSINGAFRDVAVMIDAYENLKEKHGIDEWDEAMFEKEENRHHVRRGFELLYRNIIQMGRATETPIEYLMQYGVHVQQAEAEVRGYVKHTNERIANGELLSSSDCEDFLDQMADKYLYCVDEVNKKLFGKAEVSNKNYMRLLEAAE